MLETSCLLVATVTSGLPDWAPVTTVPQAERASSRLLCRTLLVPGGDTPRRGRDINRAPRARLLVFPVIATSFAPIISPSALSEHRA